jgi:hypothetical protein
MAKGNLKQDK